VRCQRFEGSDTARSVRLDIRILWCDTSSRERNVNAM